jgi:hypothetical protein
VKTFIRHYLEMVVAMVVGMEVLSIPLDAVYDVSDRPALMLTEMAVTMTLPMVAWMRFRGHGWRASNEMAASMLLPAAGTLALLASGLVSDTGTLLLLEHAVMLPSMLVAMLLRRDEYTGHDHHHHAQVAA